MQMKEQIVICMPLKNAEKTLAQSIQSVLDQKQTKRNIMLLIGHEESTDQSTKILQGFRANSNVLVLKVKFGNVAANRNYLLQYAKANIANCVLIGRLDADDLLVDDFVLSKVERLYEQHGFDVLICGNKQIKNGRIGDWENRPSKKLLDPKFLLQQLREMANGNPRAELPSCNTFIRPEVDVAYPDLLSAEDHWFVCHLLARKKDFKIHIAEQLLYAIYNLDGSETIENKRREKYLDSRKKLFDFFSSQLKNSRPKENFVP